MPVDPLEEGWTAAAHVDSKAAETQGLIRAIEWCFRNWQPILHVFCFDSQTSGFAGSGAFKISQTDRQLRLLRGLSCALDSFCGAQLKPEWRYVKAHANELGNEIADVLAKRAASLGDESWQGRRPDYAPHVCGDRLGIEFLWMVFQKDRKICPVADSSAIVLPPLSRKHGVEERLPQSLFEASPGTFSEKKLSLFCATYNVFTLGKQAGNFVGYLRDQVQAHGIDVLFLQETRSKKSSMVLSQTHIRIVSEAVHGKGGTEIWLLRATTSNRGKGFVPEQVQVLLADPEMLILKAAYRGTDFLLGSMHAPHSGHDSSTIQAYWKGLGRQLKPYLSKYNNFVFGTDANAHFAAPCDGCIGDVGLETRTNIGGEAMKDFLMEVQGFLPSTYEHIHEGQDFTWQSSANGSVSRCDYLILPCNWTHANIKSWVLHTLDTAKDAIDHWPLAVQIKLVWNLPQPKSSRPAFCRQKLAMATGAELNALLSHVEVPKWEEDIDTRATKLSGQIHGLLCEHFPKSKQQPRKSFISQATWELRRSRIRARRCTQGLKARIDLCSLRAFFLAWFHDCSPQREGLFAELFGHIKQVLCSKAHTAALTVKLTH